MYNMIGQNFFEHFIQGHVSCVYLRNDIFLGDVKQPKSKHMLFDCKKDYGAFDLFSKNILLNFYKTAFFD